ncbi:translocation/assembly module TamB domain-containing protein [Pannus brasiliensis CCIBt3594]|uniref:Translocation/assembly module TamB domain-containing protein n=1 Tax=Pannus brasiliensis CCIBt3594 TaxID=1427578 RepID=A0AAW9QRF0_9CHRO
MTNSPPEPPSRPNSWLRLWRFARRPSTLIVGGLTVAGLTTAGYFGIRYFVYERLSPLLETQLSQFLRRPVTVGEVESFQFNRIRLGPSIIPKTATDPDRLSVRAIEVGVNPFPLLLGLPLPIDVKVIDPNIYLEQDKNGRWISVELPRARPGQKAPIPLDVRFAVEKGDISLKPTAIQSPVTIEVTGNGRFIDNRQQPLEYNLDASILGSAVRVRGETELKTGKTQTKLSIDRLALGQLFSVLPFGNLQINRGQADANLAIDVPSFEKIEGTRGTGKVNINGVSGRFQPLRYPIELDLNLDFQGQSVVFQKARAKIGEITANVSGDINWEKGYNLNVALDRVDIPQLLKIIYLRLPVPIFGEARSRFSVTGNLDRPLISGSIANTKKITVDKIPFQSVTTDFQTNLNTLRLTNTRLLPVAGGRIIANGNIQLNILKSIQANQKIDGTKMPIALTARATLPTREIISPYARLSPAVTVNHVNANTRVDGTLARPRVSIDWQIPPAPTTEALAISGRGKLGLGTDRLTLTDTVIRTGGGVLNVTADGNFKTKALQANLRGNSFLLTPFVPIACENVPDLCPYLRALDPVRVNTADIRLRGRLDRFSLETLNGIANLNLQARQGTIAVNSQVSGGNLTATARAAGLPVNPFLPDLPANVRLVDSRLTIAGSLPRSLENTADLLQSWRGEGNFALAVNNQPVLANASIDRGFVRGTVNTSGLNLAPFLPDTAVPVRLGTTSVNFSGALAPVLKNTVAGLKTWRGDGTVQLFVNDRPLETVARLDRGILSGVIDTPGLSLSPFLPNITVPVRLGQSRLNFTAPIDTLLAGKTPDIGTLDANGNVRLFVASSPINADIRMNNGIFNTIATSNQIPVDRFFPNLPVPVAISRARVQASGNVRELLASFNRNQLDFSSITALIDSRLKLAGGTVNATARLNNNLWQSQIGASGLNTALLVNRFSGRKVADLPDLNATARLSGNLADLFKGTASIRVGDVSARLGESFLDARGDILLENLARNPDIARVDLNVQARANLDRLPLQSIVDRLPIDDRFRPAGVNLAGIARFNGKVTGRNLLTALNRPGSLQASGDVALTNFRLNDRIFEPSLTGTLRAGLGQNIALDLRGNEDFIAFSLDPCTRTGCLAPYLPLAFNIRQTYGNQPPFIARGRRQGERLIARIERFPLEILNITPGVAYSLPGALAGDLNADLDVNLFTLEGQGRLRIDRPGLGKRRAESIVADLSFQDGVVRLQEASLVAGRSRFDASGLFNFRTGEIKADLDVARGYIQDLLLALRVSDVESLLRFFSPPNYARAGEVRPESVGNPDAPLSAQVNLLAKIREQIMKMANERDYVGVPRELDVRGVYQASIALAGTIRAPELSLQFQGKNWEWRPQRPTVDIIDPLGLVTTSSQFIPLDEITVNARLDRNTLNVRPIRIRSRESMVFVAGDFSLEKVAATFGTENLSLDLLRNFVQLPVDVSGNLNSTGNIGGTLFNPRVAGNFAFVNGAINAQSLDREIAGLFTYNNARFEIRTTTPEEIQFYASVPYPALPGNDRLRVQGRLGTGALGLIDAITQGAVTWVKGDGDVILDATGRVTTGKAFTVRDLVAHGLLELNNATIRSAAFPEELTVNGRIGLTPKALTVESLEGAFAERQISVVGVLPFFQPIADNPNPLTVTIQQGEVAIENLYRGSIDGRAIVTGTLQRPIIGGEVRLSNGQVFAPQPTEDALDGVDRVARQWIQPIAPGNNNAFNPLLQDFRVVLQGISTEREPLYQFTFGGALTLNGPLTQPQKLRPNGVITLDRGRVSYLDTRFLLNRRNENTIVFTPEQGLLNPDLDIQLRTILTEFAGSRNFESARQLGDFPSNEIPDDSLTRVQRIDVTLSVEGELSRLLPNLGKNMNSVCQLRPDGLPFPEHTSYSRAELEKLATCIRTVALARGEDEQLLYSPVVQLTSSPPRSEGEIVRLLGEQIFAFFNELQGKNTEQLVQFGVVQLFIPALAQGIVYDVENAISNTLGATDFNILPNLETVYRVDKQSYVRFSYDYTYNQFTVRYETRF